MGWWSTDIMGGDTPLDMQSVFDDADCDLSVEANQKEIVAQMRKMSPGEELEAPVFCFLAIDASLPIAPDIVQTAYEQLDGDEWASENEERREMCQEFKGVLQRYTAGEEYELPHQRALFEQIANKLCESENGKH